VRYAVCGWLSFFYQRRKSEVKGVMLMERIVDILMLYILWQILVDVKKTTAHPKVVVFSAIS